ncbi:transglutaminase domain-containing protein [Flavicella marina]|uniref:transglutaminase domain-containing protein n=1 Tax=Flavicella marina TaxID=1475951 RepID=UPI0012645205|nr:DUF3857 domain-containing protein [Flavicella marina]
MKKHFYYLLFFITIQTAIGQTQKFGKISKKELEESFYLKDSLANAAYLYKERKTEFQFNEQTMSFEVVTKVHEKIKIYNAEGFKYATKKINYYDPEKGTSKERVERIKAYTYNLVDGKIKKGKLSSKQIFTNQNNKIWASKTFTMPNIKNGTIIEYSYQINSPYWEIRDLDFQHEIPVRQLYFTTEIPEYFKFSKQNKGYYFVTPKRETLNRTIQWTDKYRSGEYAVQTSYEQQTIRLSSELTTYVANDIPAMYDNEPYISNINNYRGGIKYELSYTQFPNSAVKKYSDTWEAVSKSIFRSDNFGQQLEYSNYFEDDLNLLLKDVTNPSEKTIRIFEFVKKKVKWNGYVGVFTDKGVRKAYKEGSGNTADINLILVAMLREAGLTANPVLLSTRDHGIPFFPTREGFNHVIAAVHGESSGYHLLDATEPYSSPNNLPLRDLNWQGRMIASDGRSSSIKLTSNKYSEESNVLTVTIHDDFHVSGILRRKLDGLQALSYRSKNNKLSEDDLIQKLENKYNLDILNFRATNKNMCYKPLSQLIQFESDDMIEVINGKIYVDPLFFFTTNVNPFKQDTRNFPVDYGTAWKEKNSVSISIPNGYKIESIPETFGIGLPDNLGQFKYVVKNNNSQISISTEEKINTPIVSPTYYKYLKEYYGEIVSKQKNKIVLSKI